MNPKVLHIIDSLEIGGAENILFHSLNDLEKSFNNYLLILDDNQSASTLNISKLGISGISFTKMKPKWTNIILLIYKTRRYIKENNIQLCHTHLFWSTLIARLATIGTNAKVISTIHNNEFDNQHPYNSLIINSIELLTYRLNNHFIFISNSVSESYKKYISGKISNEIIYNYVNPKYFKNILVNKECFRFIFIGNNKKEKNTKLLIEVFNELNKKFMDYQLTIVGRGYEKCKDLNNKNIHFKNETVDVSKELELNDIFITLSKNEGFGLALAEAMAMGLYCFASSIPAHVEVGVDNISYIDISKSPKIIANNLQMKLESADFKNSNLLSQKRAEIFKKENYLNKLTKTYYTVLNNE